MKNQIDIPILIRALYDRAKLLNGISIVCSIAILVVDVLVIVFSLFINEAAVSAVILTLGSAAFSWRADRFKDMAEQVLRQYEFHNGLGWAINYRSITDILASTPKKVRNMALQGNVSESYFFSSRKQDPARLLENLEESAWWTKHLARRMTFITVFYSAAFIMITVLLLVVAIQNIRDSTTINNIARITLLLTTFAFSSGCIRLSLNYNLLSYDAENTEMHAIELQQRKPPEMEAIMITHNYQIARATAPLLPSWIWAVSRKDLNHLWKQRVM